MSKEIRWEEDRQRWVCRENGNALGSSVVLSVVKRRFPDAKVPKTPQKGKRQERRP